MTYTKQYAEYQNKPRWGEAKGQNCGNCAYLKTEDKCFQVEGRIEVDGWCVLWKPKH